jgi:hypothetical protein
MDFEERLTAWQAENDTATDFIGLAFGASDDDPLLALAGNARMVRLCYEYRPTLVRLARSAGASWADIGEALGMTRQGAWSEYRHLDPGGETELAEEVTTTEDGPPTASP